MKYYINPKMRLAGRSNSPDNRSISPGKRSVPDPLGYIPGYSLLLDSDSCDDGNLESFTKHLQLCLEELSPPQFQPLAVEEELKQFQIFQTLHMLAKQRGRLCCLVCKHDIRPSEWHLHFQDGTTHMICQLWRLVETSQLTDSELATSMVNLYRSELEDGTQAQPFVKAALQCQYQFIGGKRLLPPSFEVIKERLMLVADTYCILTSSTLLTNDIIDSCARILLYQWREVEEEDALLTRREMEEMVGDEEEMVVEMVGEEQSNLEFDFTWKECECE